MARASLGGAHGHVMNPKGSKAEFLPNEFDSLTVKRVGRPQRMFLHLFPPFSLPPSSFRSLFLFRPVFCNPREDGEHDNRQASR